MAPTQATDDYYLILEVTQSATVESITQSYRRLARKLHPDKNTGYDSTADFQLLLRAYETLKDVTSRRSYDLIYASIAGKRTPESGSGQNPNRATSSSKTEAKPQPPDENAQIAALQKSKQERAMRWALNKQRFDEKISSLETEIDVLKLAIDALNKQAAHEARAEAQKNSWGAWIASAFVAKVEDSEEEKEKKDREQQERRISKDMKERKLALKKGELETQRKNLQGAQALTDAADAVDDGKIRAIQEKIEARVRKEEEEKERIRRAEQAKMWEEIRKAQEKAAKERAEQDRVTRERIAKENEERRKAFHEAEKKRQEEKKEQATKTAKRNTQKQYGATHMKSHRKTGSTSAASDSNCRHDGWWSKVQGRKACPECQEVWTYLLECPAGCSMLACPKCQSRIRTRKRGSRRHERPSSPPPSFTYDYDYDWD